MQLLNVVHQTVFTMSCQSTDSKNRDTKPSDGKKQIYDLRPAHRSGPRTGETPPRPDQTPTVKPCEVSLPTTAASLSLSRCLFLDFSKGLRSQAENWVSGLLWGLGRSAHGVSAEGLRTPCGVSDSLRERVQYILHLKPANPKKMALAT